MDAIEKRARELLAVQYVNEGRMLSAKETMEGHELQAHAEYLVLRAIIAALTPPEGYVLVPAEPTEEMIAAAWRYGDGDEAPDPVYSWRAMLAARPEVL